MEESTILELNMIGEDDSWERKHVTTAGDAPSPTIYVTAGSTDEGSTQLRRRNPITNADIQEHQRLNSNEFINTLHDNILTWYPNLRLRYKEQLYFNMIQTAVLFKETTSPMPGSMASSKTRH